MESIPHKVRVIHAGRLGTQFQLAKELGIEDKSLHFSLDITPIMKGKQKPFRLNIFKVCNPILYDKLETLTKNWKVYPQTIRTHRLPGRIIVRQTELYHAEYIDNDGKMQILKAKKYNKDMNVIQTQPVVLNHIKFFAFDNECKDDEIVELRSQMIIRRINHWVN